MSALETQVGGSHYKGWKIEPIEFLIKNKAKIGPAESSIIRYACRHSNKNGVEDLRKIIHCAQLIAEIEYGVDLETAEKIDRKKIMAMCGNPDPAEACRNILAELGGSPNLDGIHKDRVPLSRKTVEDIFAKVDGAEQAERA